MKSLISLLLIICFNFSVLAQENNPAQIQAEELDAWDIEAQNVLSPFTTPAVWIMAGGTLLTYFVYQDKKNTDGIGYNPDHKKEHEDWTKVGNVLGWALLQAGYTLTQYPGIKRGEQRAVENTEIMWKSTLYTSLSTLILKLAVTEERQDSKGKYESFPSGHASAAFAFATNVALRHEWYWNFISIPLTILASTSRVNNDSHYAHDAVFGATLGISFAYGMNYLADEQELPFLLGFEPKEDGGGLLFKYNF